MLYYRYRPCGELSLKELRYNEIYFSSTAESNDPYDGKVFLSYEFDKDKWKRFLEVAWNKINDKNILSLIQSLSEYLADHCPTSYEEMIKYDFKNILLNKIQDLNQLTAQHLDLLIKQLVTLYHPGERYTVSFSKTNNNTLMWSHYSSKYKGFSLVFKAINGSLYQDKTCLRKEISRRTSHMTVSTSISESFEFQDIKYCPTIEKIDAARFMPSHIIGKEELNEIEYVKFLNENDSKYLEKHDCWSYEEEARITLNWPTDWLFGEHISYTQEERLLHYQPTQLVGIILGALMEQKEKDRIREIIRERIDRISENCAGNAVFDFVLFEAKISDKKRNMEIMAKEIYIPSQILYKNDPKFVSRYNDWKDGWAIEYNENGSGATKKQFT